MASKKTTQLQKAEAEPQSLSTINYANDVIVTICSTALAEVNGIAGMHNIPNGGLRGKGKTGSRGIKAEIGTDDVSIDLYLSVEYGTPIQQCATDAQESVRRAIESMTGLKVTRVDVHVQGVSFEREKNALEAGSKTAVLTDGADREDPKADDEESGNSLDETEDKKN